jgi:hypothetical protein
VLPLKVQRVPCLSLQPSYYVPAGRPVDVEQLPDGSLLISDDETGVLYRVTYNASNANSSSTTRRVSASQGPGDRQTSGAAAAAALVGHVWSVLLLCAAAVVLALLV